MLIGSESFGVKVLGGQIEGDPIFPPIVFGENSCVSISDQVIVFSVSDQVETLSVTEICKNEF